MAITDHGVMYGVIDFYEYAKSQGIKPILGCEVYTAARTLYDKIHEFDSKRGHLILLARNNEGYKNLMNIVSIGFVDGFYYKPRIDMNVLRENSEGLIALSACMFGDVAQNILNGNFNGARNVAREFKEIFGEYYYIELQDHNIPEQKGLNQQLIRIAREFNIPLVATNDVHYVNKSDAKYQDVLMCIQMNENVADDRKMKFRTEEMYVKSEDEMLENFAYIPEAIENTQKIADMCNVEIEFGKVLLPKYKIDSGEDSFTYLKNLCHSGLKKRYENPSADIKNRLDYELETIKNMGYTDYFLIVWDFIKYAKDNGIMVGPGRGSAAGSLTSFCLNITNIDPIKYGLIFERFLNPERITMPDIDVDFCERREEVINYVIQKYGSDHVAQIGTFGTMAAKQSIRDVGRVLNLKYSFVSEVSKEIPFQIGITIDEALKNNSELRKKYETDPKIKELIDISRALEGLPRHASIHAAGIVITDQPVKNYVPLQKNKDGIISTQFPMTTIEKLGLLKIDFLGLRTLTIIKDAVRNIKLTRGIDIDVENLPLDDAATYKMLQSGDTLGIFQIEATGPKLDFIKRLKPSTFEDIIAAISLYRPGPMDSIDRYIDAKNGAKVSYKHPLLKNILDVTYGCIVYQEQVMQIVRTLAGYSMARADLMRRVMSKKDDSKMAEERKNFIYGKRDENGNVEVLGAVNNGVDEKTASEIFDEMVDFSHYAFNKSHAAAYAMVAFTTAWLKCHYLPEFMAALLSNCFGSNTNITKYLNECKRNGVKILPPDINKSETGFTVDGGNIRFGLAGVSFVGPVFVNHILDERKIHGDFSSFRDFCERMSGNDLNKRTCASLIKAGAFDSLGVSRNVILANYEKIIDAEVSKKRDGVSGQIGLFDNILDENYGENSDGIKELTDDDIAAMEKETIGMYISGHPLDKYAGVMKKFASTTIAEIYESIKTDENRAPNAIYTVTIFGIVTKIKTKLTKNGGVMATLSIEDLTGGIDVLVFPSQLKNLDKRLSDGDVVIISGRVDYDETSAKIICNTVSIFNEEDEKPESKLYIQLNSTDKELIDKILSLTRTFSGPTPLYFYFKDKKQTFVGAKLTRTSPNRALLAELRNLVGDENVRLVEIKNGEN
jgi:DNA polymerase-3 subunit alpha